jgi:hypothetical protein
MIVRSLVPCLLNDRWIAQPGFLSANTYLLGAHETRNRDPPRPPGPTLVDVYLPDTDRHTSGLFCYIQDHERGTLQRDPEVAALQSKQNKADCLTDSESDNEDGYGQSKPTIKRVRQILRATAVSVPAVEPATATAGGDKKGKAAASSVPVTAAAASATAAVTMSAPTLGFDDDEPLLSESQKNEEQVELLRDRKMLDWESTVSKTRKEELNAIASQ